VSDRPTFGWFKLNRRFRITVQRIELLVLAAADWSPKGDRNRCYRCLDGDTSRCSLCGGTGVWVEHHYRLDRPRCYIKRISSMFTDDGGITHLVRTKKGFHLFGRQYCNGLDRPMFPTAVRDVDCMACLARFQ